MHIRPARISSYLPLLTLVLAVSGLPPAQASSDLAELAATPFEVEYEARYRGFRAQGGALQREIEPGVYQMTTMVELRLLGARITGIEEESRFSIDDGQVRSSYYSFEQSGAGSRSRSQQFDWDKATVDYTVNEDSAQMPLEGPDIEGPVLDELNAMLYLRHQVSQGATEIHYQAFDVDEIDDFLYRVTGEERVETPLGEFDAVVVERIRDPDSKRSTTLWLAKNWAYLLVKLEQIDSKDRKIEMLVKNASVGGRALSSE